MDWSETRKKLLSLGKGCRRDGAEPVEGSGGEFAICLDPGIYRRGASDVAHAPRRVIPTPRAASLCIASGKGGTGKSVVTASLSSLFSARGQTLIVDADLGVGNAHILQDVSPLKSFVEVVEGESQVRDVLAACSERCDLLAGGSGIPRMAALSDYELHLIAEGIQELESEYRFMLVDSAAGVSRQTMAFARGCDLTLVVTTPDLTAMTDAYAFVKVLVGKKPQSRPLLLVNRARSETEANEVSKRIQRVCQRFLGSAPKYIGWLPDDDKVIDCVNRRGAVSLLEPYAESSRALRKLAVVLLEELGKLHSAGLGRSLVDIVEYSRDR
ncbi:MAG: hypothetical protein CMJ89_06700 [Planctomycetes bacterium]|nr:hypothetical protein [Planctomycetota bacterium]